MLHHLNRLPDNTYFKSLNCHIGWLWCDDRCTLWLSSLGY